MAHQNAQCLELIHCCVTLCHSDGRRPGERVLGHRAVKLTILSDPVLIRGDGSFLYTFTSVVDDLDTGITHVLRGEDHVTNTGVQINSTSVAHSSHMDIIQNLAINFDNEGMNSITEKNSKDKKIQKKRKKRKKIEKREK